VAPAQRLPLNSNPFADWSAHLFVADRTQYILILNTASLYSVVTYGKGITDDSKFIKIVTTRIKEQMKADGFEFIYERMIAPTTNHVSFSKALNPSVTGSMNDLVHHARFHLLEHEVSPHELSPWLNRIPMGQLKYAFPEEAFAQLKIAGQT
jgi:hypothetical protein